MVEMIEYNFLQICKDDEIAFQTVTNIRTKIERISYKRKCYGWKNNLQWSFKTKVTYITPCKLKWLSKHHTVSLLDCSKRIYYSFIHMKQTFKKIIVRYKKIGYNINVMRQTACLVVNPIKVNSFAYLFNCTTVGRTSDWMTVPS